MLAVGSTFPTTSPPAAVSQIGLDGAADGWQAHKPVRSTAATLWPRLKTAEAAIEACRPAYSSPNPIKWIQGTFPF